MSALPDPRRYASVPPPDALLRLLEAEPANLAEALRARAAAGADDELRAMLAAAPDARTYARLWHALCAAVERPAPDAGLAARVFAMPWVIVCAGTAPAHIPCVLPDVAALSGVLESHGVFGPSRSLGLSNALCDVETLEALPPSLVLRWAGAPGVHDIPPAPIAVLRGVEEVHVRFLVGAAIAPPHAPDIVATGANIAAWGTPALRAMAAQLATPGVQLLPMARPPAGLYTAAWAGRRAGVETAFNLFASNALRRFRSSVGDPVARLSAHHGGEIRVTLSSPFDEALVEGFRWPLHPADDLAEIERTIAVLLAECRLAEPLREQALLPDLTATGARLFPA